MAEAHDWCITLCVEAKTIGSTCKSPKKKHFSFTLKCEDSTTVQEVVDSNELKGHGKSREELRELLDGATVSKVRPIRPVETSPTNSDIIILSSSPQVFADAGKSRSEVTMSWRLETVHFTLAGLRNCWPDHHCAITIQVEKQAEPDAEVAVVSERHGIHPVFQMMKDNARIANQRTDQPPAKKNKRAQDGRDRQWDNLVDICLEDDIKLAKLDKDNKEKLFSRLVEALFKLDQLKCLERTWASNRRGPLSTWMKRVLTDKHGRPFSSWARKDTKTRPKWMNAAKDTKWHADPVIDDLNKVVCSGLFPEGSPVLVELNGVVELLTKERDTLNKCRNRTSGAREHAFSQSSQGPIEVQDVANAVEVKVTIPTQVPAGTWGAADAHKPYAKLWDALNESQTYEPVDLWDYAPEGNDNESTSKAADRRHKFKSKLCLPAETRMLTAKVGGKTKDVVCIIKVPVSGLGDGAEFLAAVEYVKRMQT